MVRVFRLRFPGRHPRPVILYVHASYSGADSSLCPLCRQLFHPPFRQFVLWFAGGSSGPPPFFAIIPDGDVCSYDSDWDAAHLRPEGGLGTGVSLVVKAGEGIWRRQEKPRKGLLYI